MLHWSNLLSFHSLHNNTHYTNENSTDEGQQKNQIGCHAVDYLSVVQLPVDVDLTLSDVTSQIRDWMGDVCLENIDTVSHYDITK